MSEKQQQPETCTMINGTSQRSAATWLWWDVWPALYYKFTAESVLQEVFKLPHLSCAPVHCPVEGWRTRLRSDVWTAGTVAAVTRSLLSTNEVSTSLMYLRRFFYLSTEYIFSQ